MAIGLDDDALQRELVRLTDWHTDALFGWLGDRGATRFVNRLSRLVVDPERFADPELEPMEARGQGAVYRLTTDGATLRHLDGVTRSAMIEAYHRPYHDALDAEARRLAHDLGRCLLLDCHSFASRPLASELDQRPDRPEICLGRDAVHTPAALADALAGGFRAEGFSVAFDTPFTGTMVPNAFLGRARRLDSIMLEIRRDLYVDESTGEPVPSFGGIQAAIERAVVRSGVLG